MPDDGDEALARALDATLRCAGPGLRLRAAVQVWDGQLRRTYHGSVELIPADDLAEGCAVWLHYDKQTIGLFTAPEGDAVVEALLLSLIHNRRCRRTYACRSRWSPYH